MITFSFEIDYAATAEEVFDAFWSLEDWPEVARHVTGIDMQYEDDQVQVLRMHVRTGARRDSFQTVRIRQGHSIHYVQPSPPPALRRHTGWWHVSARNGGARVLSEHSVEIDPEGARRFLASVDRPHDTPAEIEAGVRDVLTHNSRQTMVALRDRLAAAAEEVHHAVA